MKSRCCRVSASAARWLSDSALGDHPQEDVVDVAVELGQAGIGADRLLHLALRGGAIEARQVLLIGQRAQPLDLDRDLLVVLGRGLVGGIEADRLGVILQRAAAVALVAPGRAAVVVGALEFRIEFQRGIVIHDGAVIILAGLLGVAAVGQEFRLGTDLDRFVVIGDRAGVVAIGGEVAARDCRRIPARSDRSGSPRCQSCSARSVRPIFL